MTSPAEFIGAHALLLMLILTALLLVLTVALWQLIERYADFVWRFAARSWQASIRTSLASRLQRVPLLSKVLSGSLTLGRFLGVHVLAGCVVAIWALYVFAEIADEIGIDEDLGEFDVDLSSALRANLSPGLLQAFAVITHLGDGVTLMALSLVVVVVLLIKKRWLLAGIWVFTTAGGGLLNRALKSIFERARPPHDTDLLTTHSYSFPSGHAAGSMVVYGMLAYLLFLHAPRAWHLPITIMAMALITIIGFSRVFLQVHYFSDVIAGYVSAIAWLAVCIAGVEAVRRARPDSFAR